MPAQRPWRGQHHEVGVAALDIERIVRLQRNEHGAAAALVDEVEAVIEELAEQREPRVERRREAFVRRDVGQMDVVALHFDAERLERGIAHDARSLQIRYGERVGRDARSSRASIAVRVAGGRRRSLASGCVLHHDAGLVLGVETPA